MNISHFLPQDHKDRIALLGVVGAGIAWVVGMSVIAPLAEWLSFGVLGLERGTPFGEAVSFFLYDVPKILLLLVGMVFVITLLQSFVNMNRVRATLEKRGEGVGNLLASGLGAITPFCSCSSVPLFIGFLRAGVPLGMAFSFLITSPIMNEVAFVLLLSLFGWQVAVVYLISGIAIGTLAGILLGRMKLEHLVEPFIYEAINRQQTYGDVIMLTVRVTWRERFAEAAQASLNILRKVWLFVLIGIGVGAFLHNYAPEGLLAPMLGAQAWWSVPLAVGVGIPMYASDGVILPIASAFFNKGAAMGTVLAFMMSAVALSLPEMIILRQALKPRLIATFVAVVGVSIVFTGYLFNAMFG
jgi:uncharacterized membrane protein YraQ (UPF0718 family)